MTTHAIHNREDGTIELTVTVPWTDVQKVYEQVIEKTVKNTELSGFRKGKAPRALIEEKIDKNKVYEEVIHDLLPQVYNDIITKEKLKPIISPKVELKDAKEGSDWQLVIYTCQKPKIELKDYKKAVKEGKAEKLTKKKIWVPGQEKEEEKEKEEVKKPTMDEILGWVLSTIVITVPSLLLEQEINRLLSNLIDQTKSLGMSVESYLSATGKTAEGIRKEYEEQAKNTMALEFGLEEIADKEGILVEDDEIEKVISSAKTDTEKKQLEGQKYYIASVLRRQKTLDFLAAI